MIRNVWWDLRSWLCDHDILLCSHCRERGIRHD